MRRLYLLAGLFGLGVIGLVGWDTLGSAQPAKAPPVEPPPLIEAIPDVGKPSTKNADKPSPIKIEGGFANDRGAEETKPASTPARNRAIPGDLPPESSKEKPIIEPIENPKTGKDVEPFKLPIPDPKSPVKVIDDPKSPVKITDTPKSPMKTTDVEKPENSKPTSPMSSELPVGNRPPEVPAVNIKSEPAVSLEWIGPASVKVGMPCDYTLVVRNTSAVPVQKVVTQARIPQPVSIISAEPKGEGAEGVMMWELGTLLPKQERRIQMKLMSPNRGDMGCQAWVTFTGSSVMRLMVREPKLLVKVSVPKELLVGDAANITMTVSNPGDHPAERVKITANLGDGLESVRGNKLNYDLGTLSAGETRTLQFPCVTKTPGEQKCEAFVEAEGGLKAGDHAALMVIQPRIDLIVSGPKRRYLDRKAVYTFKVTNPGNAPASNVFITDVVPNGLKYVQADSGGQYDFATRSVKWFVGELAPGEHKEVKAEFTAMSLGEQNHKVSAHASRGIKTEQEVTTTIEGLSAVDMEAIATENPIEVGTETTYEIKVTNVGTGPETDVKLVCSLPPQVKMKSATGPTKYDIVGNEIIFQPMPKMAQRGDAVYKITVTATTKGDARFRASLTTAAMVEPVIKVVPLKIYED